MATVTSMTCAFPIATCYSPRSTSSPKYSMTGCRRLYQQKQQEQPKNKPSEQQKEQTSGTVRFTGWKTSELGSNDRTTNVINPVDMIISFLLSDVVSIALGIIGLTILVGHRLAIQDDLIQDPNAMAFTTRTNLLAVFACGSVLLNGITQLDITSALSESVQLDGTMLDEPIMWNEFVTNQSSMSSSLSTTTPPPPLQQQQQPQQVSTIQWALQALLVATSAKTAILLTTQSIERSSTTATATATKTTPSSSSQWTIMAMAGIVPSRSSWWKVPSSTPILDRVGAPTNTKETYLPTLQNLPGKIEFTYLPSNTQLVLLLPIVSTTTTTATTETSPFGRSVLVLGSNTAKSMTPRDIAWARVIAERMGELLHDEETKDSMTV